MTIAIPSRKELSSYIHSKLKSNLSDLKANFQNSVREVGVRYCYLDDLLPNEIANRIDSVFPKKNEMRLMDSFREKKYTSKDFNRFDPLLEDITFAIQDDAVIRIVEEITGIQEQRPDPSLYAGGLSRMEIGNFLNPHIDNSHEMTRTLYRTLNLLYYVSPQWSLENGGNLELWDKKVRNRITIESKFNRLVLMETNPWSWHSVSPVVVDRNRNCVSNYYFSRKSPIGVDYFNVTSYSARPEEPLKRILSNVDNKLRGLLRILKRDGFGKKDFYQNNQNK
ncbi:2OG-Fe(II) oxygenase [Leptospira kmetyi]|uniref:2OG-Fe(II) oxygenase n=1 Tax=Leptospira kmetyi TaxID=408139 RepID=A0ABX4N8V3_9LEPT|nr:2OG-Fe(II) oxygenase [Leptospira kmetyi]EQA54351.1 2OG-Fe(II) oxygenase family protein [Leptospira kmetyi serovar Malaysia str. Bejo-Iso9]PJZ29748.1 2OG-Fe(II) oxygenase [Leptospira kmetyi]